MPLFQIIVILIVIGVLLWLANTYLPMDAKIKQILNVFVVVIVIIWLLSLFLGPNILHSGPYIGR
jgi:hypothetical protein